MQVEYENYYKHGGCCSDVSQTRCQYFQGFRKIYIELSSQVIRNGFSHVTTPML